MGGGLLETISYLNLCRISGLLLALGLCSLADSESVGMTLPPSPYMPWLVHVVYAKWLAGASWFVTMGAAAVLAVCL